MSPLRAALLLVAVLFLPNLAHAQQGGFEVWAGEPLGDGVWRAGIVHTYEHRSHVYHGSDQENDPFDRILGEHAVVLSLEYGVLGRMTFSALVPIEHKTLRFRDPAGGTTHLRAYGLGDITLMGKVLLYKTDWKQGAFHLAFIGGVELATGDPSETRDQVRLPRSVQIGSGSWNVFGAIGATWSHDRFRVDSHVTFKLNPEGRRDYDEGEEVTFELDGAYRFWHADYPGPSASVKLGVAYKYEGRDTRDGHHVRGTGNQRVMVHPGFVFHPIPRLDITLKVDVPVYQHYRERQLGRDVKISTGFAVRF